MSNCSFLRKISDLENRSFFAHFHSFALFERAKERSLFFVTLFERAKERSLFLSLFLKEQKNDRSFKKSKKRAIPHLLFCKERRKE